MKTPKTALLTLFLALAAAGCGSNNRSGSVQAEAQNNDSPGSPQSLGVVDSQRSASVRGSISAFDDDQFDNYRIEAGAATTVDFELTAEGSSADLDVWLTDETGAVLQRFESDTAGSETGSFDLEDGEVALLVVTATETASDYLLEVSGQ